MTERKQITCNQTLAVANHRVFQPDLNEHGTVFGGKILSLADDISSIAASRLARQTTATVSFDHVTFLHPFAMRDSMCLETYVTGTGTRSLEVFAKVIGEHLFTGERFLGFTSFATFVVLDKDPTFVLPEIVPETPEQQFICAGYAERTAARKAARQQNDAIQDHIDVGFPWKV